MNENFIRVQKTWRSAILFAVMLFTTANASAQTYPKITPPYSQPAPQSKSSPSLEKQFVKNILLDQVAIWTSPLHVRRSDARYLVPLGAGTAALIATDRRTAGEVDDFGSLPTVSRKVSFIGSGYATGGVAAAFYLYGRARHDARARETGLLGAEALIDGGIVGQGLKFITERPRPRNDGGRGSFFTGGNSFPSGHAIAAWSVATVVAQEYGKRRPLVRFGAYGLATAVSLSRYTGRNHFLSDALVGSAIGYGIGRYVYHKRHDPNLDGHNEQGTQEDFTSSKLFPLITPRFGTSIANNRRAHDYGLTLAWSF